MEDKSIMKVLTEDGKEIEYRILCAFALKSTGKNYVIYTDNTDDSKKEKEIYASIYYPDDDTRLDDIETDEEWDIIKKILNDLGVIDNE